MHRPQSLHSYRFRLVYAFEESSIYFRMATIGGGYLFHTIPSITGVTP